MNILRTAFAGALFLASATSAFVAQAADFITIQLKDGPVVIELNDKAPKHAERIKALAAAGEYDNVVFHRVIKGFMAQTGDVQYGDMNDGYDAGAAGTGGSDKPNLPAEFTDKAKFERGTVGMARSQNPNSANSQFFIMFQPAPPLDNQYTIVGEVESGMETVDKIKRGDDANNGSVTNPDRMVKVTVGK